MNEYDKVMTKNLTESFVDHRDIGLASQAVTELSLHHAEGRFDVGPLMVVLQEVVAPELKVVEHFRPCSPARSHTVRFESDERGGSYFGDCISILPRTVGFVGGYFGDFMTLFACSR